MEFYLGIQSLLLFFSVLSNSMHLLAWLSVNKACKPVKLLKTLQSGVFLVMTVTVFPLEMHALNNGHAIKTSIAGNY
jgi:hypothetical protein